MHITVGHHHRVFLSQNVVPGTYGRLAFTHIDVTGLAVVVAEGAVGLLHHVGRPDHLGGRPVHHQVLPIAKILRHPHLCRAIAVARAIGGGIKIIRVTKLTDGGVGKITWDKRISGSRGVPLCRAWQLCAHLERIGKFLQLRLWVGILFRWHRYLLMQCGSSHDNQVQVSQPLALRDGETRSIDVAIDFLILCGDADKPVSQVLAPYLQTETGCIQVHLVVEQNGIESIFLRIVIRTVPSVGTCQLGVESAGIFSGLPACMFEVEVH